MNTYHHLQNGASLIEEAIDYVFQEKNLLYLAFVHRSFANENRRVVSEHNERLEFLGDAVLGLLVSDFLYSHFPDHPEGELSYLRSRLVEAPACMQYLQKIQLEDFLLVGRGESMNEGKGRGTLLADLFEAIIGALYLDGGIEAARRFFFSHFEDEIFSIIEKPLRNWKAELQEYCQKKHQVPPSYEVISEEGPDHLKIFYIRVLLQGKELGRGEGLSKKEAEQSAAQHAVERLGF